MFWNKKPKTEKRIEKRIEQRPSRKKVEREVEVVDKDFHQEYKCYSFQGSFKEVTDQYASVLETLGEHDCIENMESIHVLDSRNGVNEICLIVTVLKGWFTETKRTVIQEEWIDEMVDVEVEYEVEVEI